MVFYEASSGLLRVIRQSACSSQKRRVVVDLCVVHFEIE